MSDERPPRRPFQRGPRPPRRDDFGSGEREGRFRAFISVHPPEDVLVELGRLQEQLREEDPELEQGVSWARGEGLHITLQFLSDITDTRAKAIGRILDEVAADYPPFTIDLAALGAFPKAFGARNLWVGVRKGAEILSRLQREVEDRLIRIGFPREGRSFEPHLTLARFKMPRPVRRLLEVHAGFLVAGVPVKNLYLMRSELMAGGSRYTPVHTTVLGNQIAS